MNMAIELLEKCIKNNSEYLEILKEREEYQRKWSECGQIGREQYYHPLLKITQNDIKELEKGIEECKNAIVAINIYNDSTESPSDSGSRKESGGSHE